MQLATAMPYWPIGTRADATGEAPLFWMDPRGDVAELEGFEAFLLAQLQFQKDVLEE